jgi:hypothetical protein
MKNRFYSQLFLAFVLGCIVSAGTPFAKGAMAADPVTLKVYDPTGAIEVTQLFAPRLDTLEGKTICELWDASWEGDRTFPLIRDLLQGKYPTAKFVPYTEFPIGSAVMQAPGIDQIAKKKGCQAAIVGNAG